MIIVETERLILRHFRALDSEALARVFGDAEVMRFGPGVQSPQWVRDWLRGCLVDYYQKLGYGPWAVVEKTSRAVIGYSGLFYFPDIAGRPEIELGYRLARLAWGRGYATEAAHAVRDLAFTTLGLKRLIAMIDPANGASIRVAEKIGMQYEKDIVFGGYNHPDRIYSISSA